ncbi:MAG: biopolymer transporter ExbD [Verrucomicrobia bacterium]|nr:biopolymer transporter ExbD [Verrucomicrobiota bacterium]MBI3870907.1 biopolymer transporter ExbD [Verrucomicrobiota bacterium]
MRRFSQRNSLVTLNEINITPLLDLAFVLLIIFVITTPMLEQGLDLKLPDGGVKDRNTDRVVVKTVDISMQGTYYYAHKPLSLEAVEKALVEAHRQNTNMIVYIRGDEGSPLKHCIALLNRLQERGIKDYSLRTSTPKK